MKYEYPDDSYDITTFMIRIQNAAKLSIMNKIGLSCDPVAGRVICPCVNRNVEAATTAYSNACKAMNGIDDNTTSFDDNLQSMYETGKSLDSRYRETS